jgi:hypothetical protein
LYNTNNDTNVRTTDISLRVFALPGKSLVNTNAGNNRRETVFCLVRAEQKHGAMGSLLPGNSAVNLHPQQWQTVFSVESVQRSYLKDERRYEFSSEFSAGDSSGRFVVEDKKTL